MGAVMVHNEANAVMCSILAQIDAEQDTYLVHWWKYEEATD